MGYLDFVFFEGSLPIFTDELPTMVRNDIFREAIIREIICG